MKCILVIYYISVPGVWEIHMPSFEISIWNMRICLKITKIARQRRRPMSKRPDCYELMKYSNQMVARIFPNFHLAKFTVTALIIRINTILR